MSEREILPQRRRSETFEFSAGTQPGAEITYTATLGFYPDDRLGEIFLRAGKSGTDICALAPQRPSARRPAHGGGQTGIGARHGA